MVVWIFVGFAIVAWLAFVREVSTNGYEKGASLFIWLSEVLCR